MTTSFNVKPTKSRNPRTIKDFASSTPPITMNQAVDYELCTNWWLRTFNWKWLNQYIAKRAMKNYSKYHKYKSFCRKANALPQHS